MEFSKQEYLSIYGAVLFGLAASFYLISWARLVEKGVFFKEWKFLLWSFAFFLATLLSWWINWELIQYIDDSVLNFILAFIETAIFFTISAIINPTVKKFPNWKRLKDKTDEILLAGAVAFLWGFVLQVVYGVELLILPWINLIPLVLAILWLLFKKRWITWIFLIYILLLDIWFILTL